LREPEHVADSLIAELTDDDLLGLTERKLIDDAAEYLGGDRVHAVFRGQTVVSPAVVPIIGPLFLGRPRSVIVTDTTVVTVQESIWFQSRVVRLVSKYRRGSVPLELTRLGLKVADDAKIFAMLGTFPAMRRVATVGSQSDT